MSALKYEYGVFIGRFQPPHLAHLKIIESALAECKQLIIVIGSHNEGITIRNPWTSDERKHMIQSMLTTELNLRIQFVYIEDFLYNLDTWLSALQNQVTEITKDCQNVALYGHFKDDSSEYLNYFPQWSLNPQPNHENINATDVRRDFFTFIHDNTYRDLHGYQPWANKLKSSVSNSLLETQHEQRFLDLAKEFFFIQDYKKKWDAAPFRPIFVTVDALVVASGHLLLVERGTHPGKGKFALPGGFINQSELIKDAIIRELKEETKIRVNPDVLKNALTEIQVFDHPERSSRGRTITHVGRINLSQAFAGKPLPPVKGADDAAKAFWMPFAQVIHNQNNFFEDHFQIIMNMINI